MNKRNETLLEIIRQGLEVSEDRETEAMLGNRSSYLGLSDLAKYAECPRAALLAKIYPQDNSLSRLLTLQRGHWFENGLAACFNNLGLKFLPQLEIGVINGGVPIRGHLDFTLVWNDPRPAVRIVEIKSMGKLPEQPYPAHVFQAQAQVSLLTQFWQEQVFTLRGPTGRIIVEKLTFPQVCERLLHIKLPDKLEEVSVESWLICLSMREVASFGPYVHEAQSVEDMFVVAEKFWEQYGLLRHNPLAEQDIPYLLGFNPLCAFCEFNGNCPKFLPNEAQLQWGETIKRHEQLKNQRATLDAEIKDIESFLKDACKLSGGKVWIESGSYRFRVTNTAGRKTLDRDGLSDELAAIFRTVGLDDIDVNALFAKHERIGAASSRLNIMPVN